MSKLPEYGFWAVVLLSVLSVIWAGVTVWLEAEEAAELSCLGSVHTAVSAAIKQRDDSALGITRELSPDEIRELLREIKAGDCYRRDYLLEQLHVSIGKVNVHYESPVRVWSNGWDGVSGTDDDLIVPFQEMQWFRELRNR